MSELDNSYFAPEKLALDPGLKHELVLLTAGYALILDEKRQPTGILEQIAALEHNVLSGTEIVIGRELFGEGKLGDIAFATITKGTRCEIKDEEVPCERKALMTIDYDIMGGHDFKAVCSLEHAKIVEDGVNEDLKKIGGKTVFGLNGFGRTILKAI